MSYPKSIVLGLAALWKAGEPLVLALGWELLTPAGDNLVCVCLVPYVPDDLVIGRIEAVMQGDGQFNRTKVRSQMTAGIGNRLQKEPADFLRKCRQLLRLQPFQIAWTIYCFE